MIKNRFNFFIYIFPRVFPQKNKGIFIIKTLLIVFSFFNPSFAHEGCRHNFSHPLPKNRSKKGASQSQESHSSNQQVHLLNFELAIERLSLKKQIQQSSLLNPSEKQSFLKELDETILFIRNQVITPKNKIKKRARLKSLEPLLLKALQETSKILSFLENTPSPYLNKKQSVQIIFTSLTKFVRVHLSHPDEESLIDYSRYKKILTSIGAFDNNLFSIYKITRAVKEKHSIYEYLNCN